MFIHFTRTALVASLLALAVALPAQYQVYQWASFEDGRLPADAAPIGKQFQQSVAVVDLNSVAATMPPEFRAGKSSSETGRFGMALNHGKDFWFNGAASGVTMDRGALGATGRALYQADFYLPPSDEPLPNLAVCAMVPMQPGEDRPNTFYRFGITKNKIVYFSYVTLGETTAKVFQADGAMALRLGRPGWHRFAIVFEGEETIRCYVDGQEASFSPLKEASLRQLQVGIVLIDSDLKDGTYTAYADNLSIQWTTEDVPLPDSPYLAPGQAPATVLTMASPLATPSLAAPAQAVTSIPAPTPAGGGNTYSWGQATSATPTPSPVPSAAPISNAPANTAPIQWYEAEDGWALASNEKKPMIVYFQAPRLPATIRLNEIFQSDPEARGYVNRYIPVIIDVNQLQGGMYASYLNVTRVPTLIVFDGAGKETGRATFTARDSWSAVVQQLGN